ncbi:methyl-accepting chemotaxis protein [Geopsychrobacter electrodiphilus]|uniref:methyl-accepting chemotaxis protein n=1 Tax=Geopsychrobacter electrodiphilus TaxID=225196 RepID=UPI000376F729|nr:methyl-accepting chemotaxis protein [Geopsychrobacter electrodiphilus]
MNEISSSPQVAPSHGSDGLDRCYLYAFAGFMLGVAAPLGWMLLRAVFFGRAEGSFFGGMLLDIVATRENLFHYIYMGAGTSIVLSFFGYFIGRSAQQIHQRADRLDEMHRTVAGQKEDFARRYRELNDRIRNFHGISARFQSSMDEDELYGLSCNALHDVLEFERVNLLMVDAPEKLLRFVDSRGGRDVFVQGVTLPLDERAGVLYKAVIEKRQFFIDDVQLMPEDFRLKPPCDEIPQLRSKSFLISPVVVNGNVTALICLDNKNSTRPLEETDSDTLKLLTGQLSAAIVRMELVGAVVNLTDELELTFKALNDYRERYQKLLASLKASSSSTRKLVGDIASSADVIRDAVNATQSASGEISVSIEQVGGNILQLSEFMEKSISAMSEIAAAIRSVEEHSVQSHKMSQQASERAEHGALSVQETLKGLTGIRAGVEEAATAMSKLSGLGSEVSSITSVISDIAQKTNLLALNAAIIAAQAGEQGRSFAVVAEEIRELSQQSGRSSAAIAGLIRDMQNGMIQVVTQIGNTQKLVDNGFDKGRGADMALGQILDTAGQAMEMALRIRQATREVSTSAEFVTRSIEELGNMTEQVSSASREQAQGARSIVRAIEDVRHMTEGMVDATLQQRQNSDAIEGAVDSVSELAMLIFNDMEKRRDQSRNVIDRLKQIQEKS